MFKLGGKYKTRDGRDARVICLDCEGHNHPIVYIVRQPYGRDDIFTCAESGLTGIVEGASDLMPRAKEVTRWHPNSPYAGFASSAECQHQWPDYTPVPITFTIPDDGG